MPVLKDFVASLVSSITDARVSADMESAKVAQTYLDNKILRQFAVPRMRIGDIVMNVPVAIDFTAGKTAINYRVNLDIAAETVFSAVCFGYNLKVTEVENDRYVSDVLHHDIYGIVSAFQHDVESYHSLDSLYTRSREIANTSQYTLMAVFPDVAKIPPATVIPSIETTLRNEFLLTSIDKIDVLVEASQLKAQLPQTILNLNIKLVEDGMIWAISENEQGSIETKLIPE
ncbi:MAG: hypothetical protein LBK03_03185 [Bacteroidales bacterium]|jgi:hypothetical protein|nr:hypothetical protein [Bacteroidales bacterium]